MIVRPTIRGEARQVHRLGTGCNCHDLIKWVGRGFIVGEGLEIDDACAEPSDWIVKIGDDVRVVKNESFPLHYEEMTDEEEV